MASEKEDTPVPSLDHRKRTDIVLKRFVEGMSIPNIQRYLEREHGIVVGRDVPYQDIARATNKRWLQYTPPSRVEIGKRLIEKRPELLDVFIPSFGEGMATVASAANLCASAIYDIAAAKARGIALGKTEKGIDHWRFPVRVTRADADQPVESNYEDVDDGEIEDQNIEPLPMRIIVRIGFSGGNTMALTSRDLGNVIAAHIEGWEKELKSLVIHKLRDAGHQACIPQGIVKRRFKVALEFVMVNLNSGFDPEPHTNPIAFLSSLLHLPMLGPRTTVEIFNAMPFVEIGKCRSTIERITSLRDVRRDFEDNGFDIILTSGGCLDDPHSTYRRYYKDKRVHRLLADNGVVGDFMWLPITAREPFDLGALKERVKDDPELSRLIQYRPMTLLTLEDVAAHVAKKRDVFCVLAPCGVCGLEKSAVAKALLSQNKGLVTHFVLDRDTADATIEAIG